MQVRTLSLSAPELRIGILSDTHAYLDPRVADTLSGCRLILHAGDICDARILDQLAPLAGQVVAVAGNNDLPGLWPAEQHDIVAALPQRVELQVNGDLIVMEHGHRLGGQPSHARLRCDYPEARLIVYGHTHFQVWDRDARPWIVNPGAAGRVRTQGGPSCAILTVTGELWTVELKRFPDSLTARVA